MNLYCNRKINKTGAEVLKIFDIKRFAVHDGRGIRTTVFFKGCPLKCIWCHNPEGIKPKSQLAYFSEKCIGCGECVSACMFHAHQIDTDGHHFDRNACRLCGNCEKGCLAGALKLYGSEATADEILPVLLEDMPFYESSDGGVTLSGGECLLQAEACAELLKKLKEHRVNTAVDTCGFVPRQSIAKVIPYTDMFLYDIKAYDEDVHIRCTGRSNKLILENIKYIDSQNVPIEVRIPYVPDFNGNQLDKIGKFLTQLKCVTAVKVLPYHNYAGSKYGSLGMRSTLPERLPREEDIKAANDRLRSFGLNTVI